MGRSAVYPAYHTGSNADSIKFIHIYCCMQLVFSLAPSHGSNAVHIWYLAKNKRSKLNTCSKDSFSQLGHQCQFSSIQKQSEFAWYSIHFFSVQLIELLRHSPQLSILSITSITGKKLNILLPFEKCYFGGQNTSEIFTATKSYPSFKKNTTNCH